MPRAGLVELSSSLEGKNPALSGRLHLELGLLEHTLGQDRVAGRGLRACGACNGTAVRAHRCAWPKNEVPAAKHPIIDEHPRNPRSERRHSPQADGLHPPARRSPPETSRTSTRRTRPHYTRSTSASSSLCASTCATRSPRTGSPPSR